MSRERAIHESSKRFLPLSAAATHKIPLGGNLADPVADRLQTKGLSRVVSTVMITVAAMLFFIIAIASIEVVGVIMAGWASNSKWMPACRKGSIFPDSD